MAEIFPSPCRYVLYAVYVRLNPVKIFGAQIQVAYQGAVDVPDFGVLAPDFVIRFNRDHAHPI